MEILSTLAPVFLIIGLGAVLRRTGALEAGTLRTMTWLAYWIGLPALLFENVATAEFDLARAWRLFLVLAAGTWACIPVAYVAAHLLRLRREVLGTFVQAGFRSNLSFIGLPVLLYASAGLEPQQAERLQAVAILAMTPLMAVNNPMAVVILLASRDRMDRSTFRRIAGQVARNPLLIACLAGLAYGGFGPPLPLALGQSLESLGEMALPLALIAIGGTLAAPGETAQGGAVWTAAVLRVGLSPLLGLMLLSWVALPPEEARTALIFLACPTAVSSYPVVVQLGGHEGIASRVIALSTGLCLIPLTLILLFF